MKIFPSILPLLLLALNCQPSGQMSERMVDIMTVNPNIRLDIRYATENNFLGEAVYPAARCFVRETVALKLDSIQKELELSGLGLKIFDGYRPHAVSVKMWEILPDDRYVANPAKGSLHNRGVAVDVTLVDSTGQELQMPTAFDDFTERAAHAWQDLPEEAIKNRSRLKQIMIKYGFTPIRSEWWHYNLKNYEQYPILDISFKEIDSLYNQN